MLEYFIFKIKIKNIFPHLSTFIFKKNERKTKSRDHEKENTHTPYSLFNIIMLGLSHY